MRACIPMASLAVLLASCAPQGERPAGVGVPAPDVRVTPDVVYGHKHGMALTFDLYQPRQPNGAGVILLNSGGWQSWFPDFYVTTDRGVRLRTDADIEAAHALMRAINFRSLLDRGFTVFVVRHGSSPKFVMPEIVGDIRQAVRFIRHIARQYGVDNGRLGLWGLSAGGQLALLVAATAEVGDGGASDASHAEPARVAAVVAYCPVTDFAGLHASYAWFREHPIGRTAAIERLDGEFSPISFVTADDPPALIVHGDADETVPFTQGESVYRAFLAAGVEARLLVLEGAPHDFHGDYADRARTAAVAWFEEHLGR